MFEPDTIEDSLDLVEQIMALDEELGIEFPREFTEEDCERWRRTGEWPFGDGLQGARVPRHGPFPTLSGGAAAIPEPEAPNEVDEMS